MIYISIFEHILNLNFSWTVYLCVFVGVWFYLCAVLPKLVHKLFRDLAEFNNTMNHGIISWSFSSIFYFIWIINEISHANWVCLIMCAILINTPNCKHDALFLSWGKFLWTTVWSTLQKTGRKQTEGKDTLDGQSRQDDQRSVFSYNLSVLWRLTQLKVSFSKFCKYTTNS